MLSTYWYERVSPARHLGPLVVAVFDLVAVGRVELR